VSNKRETTQALSNQGVQIGNTVRVRVGEPIEVLDLLDEWRARLDI
jgi:hypothetical protein